MNRLYLLVLGFLFTVFACKSRQSVQDPIKVAALEELVQSKSYKMQFEWAEPQTTNAMQQVLNTGILGPGNTAGSINLIGNPNFLRISGDSVKSYLPYFGERQMNVNYGGRDSAIELEGLMKNYEVKTNKDASKSISFDAKGNNENYNVFIRLFPNLNSNIVINSTSRFPIRYTGSVESIKEIE